MSVSEMSEKWYGRHKEGLQLDQLVASQRQDFSLFDSIAHDLASYRFEIFVS